jgi:glutathionylspermidine synthase
MQRVACEERSDWRELADKVGFVFHSTGDAPYWDESAYYAFTLEEIERDLEAPTAALDGLCRELGRTRRHRRRDPAAVGRSGGVLELARCQLEAW